MSSSTSNDISSSNSSNMSSSSSICTGSLDSGLP